MATARNDITGAALRSKAANEAYLKNYELIFGRKDKKAVAEAKKDVKFCEACRNTGLIHCSDPLNCGGPWDDRNQK